MELLREKPMEWLAFGRVRPCRGATSIGGQEQGPAPDEILLDPSPMATPAHTRRPRDKGRRYWLALLTMARSAAHGPMGRKGCAADILVVVVFPPHPFIKHSTSTSAQQRTPCLIATLSRHEPGRPEP